MQYLKNEINFIIFFRFIIESPLHGENIAKKIKSSCKKYNIFTKILKYMNKQMYYNKITTNNKHILRRTIMDLNELSLAVQKGKTKIVKELVSQGIEEGMNIETILNEGLIGAMAVVGDNFRQNLIFVPEMLLAARSMSAGLAIIEPLLTATGVKPIGKVVIGTVKGDLHDIGKNLVAMMMKGMGATVYDLGIDVPDIAFVEKAEEVGADIVCISALLTTTMPAIDDVIKEFEKAGVRQKYRIMVGGAPVNQAFADSIGADDYSANASDAADMAKKYLESLKR